MIEILWEYRVRGDRRDEFESVYASDGRWSQFFSTDSAYLGTVLMRDVLDGLRYSTLDRWTSRAAYNSFRDSHAAEYQEIDRACADLTTDERFVGIFEVL